MAKTKATKTTTTTAPVTESKASKKVAKKTAPKKEEVPEVVAEVTNEVVETSAPVSSQPVDDVASLSEQMNELMTIFTRLSTEARSAATKLRALDKQYQRTLRVAQKSSNKKRKNTSGAPRAPSGFVKPTLISKELATFLNKPHGSEMARTEVTKEINSYIRANKLQDQKNGRIIRPDTKLANLLKIGKNDELTYFNLQKYMSPHFAKMGNKATTGA
jgi:chromatin remodeling complex protein RSC6